VQVRENGLTADKLGYRQIEQPDFASEFVILGDVGMAGKIVLAR
jgi:hypothetical protein